MSWLYFLNPVSAHISFFHNVLFLHIQSYIQRISDVYDYALYKSTFY